MKILGAILDMGNKKTYKKVLLSSPTINLAYQGCTNNDQSIGINDDNEPTRETSPRESSRFANASTGNSIIDIIVLNFSSSPPYNDPLLVK